MAVQLGQPALGLVLAVVQGHHAVQLGAQVPQLAQRARLADAQAQRAGGFAGDVADAVEEVLAHRRQAVQRRRRLQRPRRQQPEPQAVPGRARGLAQRRRADLGAPADARRQGVPVPAGEGAD